MLLLPPGAELNPFADAHPGMAVLAKVVITAAILAAPLGRFALRVRVFGAFAWGVGLTSNLIVLGGIQ